MPDRTGSRLAEQERGPVESTMNRDRDRAQAIRALAPGDTVYAVRLKDGIIKIGCSANLAGRRRAFGPESEVIGFMPGDLRVGAGDPRSTETAPGARSGVLPPNRRRPRRRERDARRLQPPAHQGVGSRVVRFLVITDDADRAQLEEAVAHLRTKQQRCVIASTREEIQADIDELIELWSARGEPAPA